MMSRPELDPQTANPTRRVTLRLLLGGTAAAAAVVAAACSSASAGGSSSRSGTEAGEDGKGRATGAATTSAAATQTSEGGQVTVKVTWSGRAAGPVFQVVLDTHAVDLDGYDLRQLATLRTRGTSGGDGGRVAPPTDWTAPKGGHHREGALSFPTTTADGAPLIDATTRTVELTIRNVAGVAERKFQWTA